MSKEIQNSKTRNDIASFIAVFICLLVLPGCGSSNSTGVGQSTNASKLSQEDTCNRLLKNAVRMLSPDRLDLEVDNKDAVGLLNQWVGDCGEKLTELSPLDAEAAKLVAGLVPESELASMDDPRFNSRDIKHVRTCLMMKSTADAVVTKGDNDLARVIDLFEFVMRNIGLEARPQDALPATAYSALLFGRGSPEDRAWIFASLLKQLKIDAVILRPQTDAPGTDSSSFDERWLVGVLLDEGVYLFDARLGCPIPSAADPGDTPTPRVPATLDEAVANPEILKSLDLPDGRPYQLSAADLDKPRVQVVGELSFWAGRMERLQLSLAGTSTVVVYDPLGDVRLKHGLIHRVAEAPHARWTKADVSLWPHPERTTSQFEDFDKNIESGDRSPETAALLVKRQKFIARALAFQAPIPLVRDKDNKLVMDNRSGRVLVQKGLREHQRARIMQLSGQFEGAKRSFTVSRMDEHLDPTIPMPDEARGAHLMAADNAMFWGAVCLLDEGDFAAAASALKRYLKHSEQATPVAIGRLTIRPGDWKGTCRALLVVCLAQLGQYDQAIKEVEKIPADDARRAGLDFLVKRWNKRPQNKPAAAGAKPAETPQKTERTPSESKPSPPK